MTNISCLNNLSVRCRIPRDSLRSHQPCFQNRNSIFLVIHRTKKLTWIFDVIYEQLRNTIQYNTSFQRVMALNVWTRFNNKQVRREYRQSGHRLLLHGSRGHETSTLGANALSLWPVQKSTESFQSWASTWKRAAARTPKLYNVNSLIFPMLPS